MDAHFMNTNIVELLANLKVGLQELYGARLQGVYLYGSYARGEEVRGSDVDVLIVLNDIPSYAAEVDRTGGLVSALALKYAVSVSRVFVSLQDWQQGQTPFLLNAREEAIAA